MALAQKDLESFNSSSIVLASMASVWFIHSAKLFCSGVYGAEVSRSVPSRQSWSQKALFVYSVQRRTWMSVFHCL